MDINIKEKLEEKVKIEELEKVIKESKNNKAPGPDGFSNDFLKFFLTELKFWLLKAYEESEDRGYFSDNVLQGYITCIPKTV